jgi:hypothetical protein
VAHETEEEFAKLLLEYDETEYNFWKEAFPLLYDGSIEEVAARETRDDMYKSLH